MSLDNPTIQRTPDGFHLVYEEVYATDIDDLWDAVTSRERLARWMADYTGELSLDGTWEVASDDDGPWGRGTVTACERPSGFTTTWHARGEEPTELVVRLEPVEGGTRLVLSHAGIRSIFYGAGWQTYLERLATHVAGADPGGEDAWQARYAQLQPDYETRFAQL